MQATMGAMSAQDMSRLRFGDDIAQGLRSALHNSGAYRVDAVKAVSATESLTTAIRKQDLTTGQYIKRRKEMNDVLKEQWRLQNASMMAWSQDAKGRISGDMIIPREAPERMNSYRGIMEAAGKGQISFAQAVNESRMRLGVYSQAIQSAALNTVNWGKNMQWAGRQLMVGLSLPFAAFGVVAAATFKTVDQEMTRILKVYDYQSAEIQRINGETVTETQRTAMMEAEANEVRAMSLKTATQSAQEYGSKIEDTLAISSELAAAGKSGIELQATTNVVNRAVLLGELDRQDALKATISLQTVYGMSVRELGDAFNYMNALENATSLQMQDMVVAIPRLSGVVKSLGGDLQDIGTLMTAAKAGGIDAAEGANALKSVLFRANAPSGAPNEESFIAATGKDLAMLREEAGGDGIELITRIGQELNNIGDPGQKIAILREVFGIYQGSKAGIIMEQLANNTEQVARANEVAAQSAAVWGNTADLELKKIQESAAGRFDIAVQSMRASLAKLGEPFLEAGIMIVNVVTKILDKINAIPDNVKKWAFIGLAIGALIGPLVMLTGLFANFFGTIAKAGATLFLVTSRFRAVSQEQAASTLASKMGSLAFTNQASAAAVMTHEIREMSMALREMTRAQQQATGAGMPTMPKPQPREVPLTTAGGALEQGALKARATDAYIQEKARLQQLVNQGVATEAEMRQQLLQVERANNPYLIQKKQLQNAYSQGLITQMELNQGLNMLERQHDALFQTRINLQRQVTQGLITEGEMKQAILRAELQMVQTSRQRAAEEARRQRIEQAGTAAGGGGALMGVAMVGMMASSMGILSSETGQWVNSIAMAVFLFSATVVAAKAIRGAVASWAVVQAGVAAATAATATGMGAAVIFTRAFAVALWSSLAPLLAIGLPLAAIGASLLWAKRRTEEVKEEWEDWADTAANTAKQVGVSLDGGFAVAAGRMGEIADKTAVATKAQEKWRKENEKSHQIIRSAPKEVAEAEVQRIGIDIFAATGDAKKAKEAMELAINGSQRKGLEVNLDLNMSNIQDEMARASTALLGDLENDKMGFGEALWKDLTNFSAPWNGGLGADSVEAIGLGEEAKAKAREMGAQIGDAYISGSMEMLSARADATSRALTARMTAMMNKSKVLDNVSDSDRAILKKLGVSPENKEQMARFFLDFDSHGDKVDGLSDKFKEQAEAAATLRAAEEEMIDKLVDMGVLNEGEATKAKNLNVATSALKDSLKIQTEEVEANTAAQEENAEALAATEEQTQALVNAQKSAMTSAWGKVLGEMDRQMENQLSADLDGIAAAGQARLDAIDADAKDMDKEFDRRSKALDDKQAARKKKEEAVFDRRIDAIEKTIEAEKKAEEQRQKIFEAEQQRIQRMADMFNQNIDFNIALNAGNMDEAAKLANNMRSTTEQWAVDDAAAASGEGSDARMETLEAQKKKEEEAKSKHMEEISKRDTAEKEALDRAKERYREDVEAQKKAEQNKTDRTRKAAEERHRMMKEQLEADLAAWRAYIPKNEADIRSHIGTLDDVYAKHGVTINTKSAEWGRSINAYIRQSTETARVELKNDQEWAAIGKTAGEAMMAGMLGMSLADFNRWSQGGMQTSKPGVTLKPNGDYKVPGGTIPARHSGGLVNDDPGSRAGRSRGAALFPDEVPTILQRGEYVVDRATTQRFGTGFFNALSESDSIVKGTFPRQRVPEAGDGLGMIAGAGEAMTRNFQAMVSSQLPNFVRNRAQAEMDAGRGHLIPKQIMDFLQPILGAAAAGKYGGTNFSDEQLSNAAQIVAVGQGMGMSQRDLVIGLMTAMQESMLRNIPGGDRDSVGLFQQRPSQGWGTVEQIMNPKYSATKFFEGLKGIEGRNGMSLTQAAQAVQRSAFPNAYAKWQDEAEAILAAMAASSASMPGAEGIPMGTIGGTGGRGVNSIGDIIGLIQRGGPKFRATSTYRPGAVTTSGNGSYHGTKNAVDFGGPVPGRDTPELLAINRHFAKFGKGLIELIYSGPGAINLHNGKPHTYSPAVQNIHHDHVHVAATKDTLAKLQMPSMAVGGEVLYDNTIANLHKKETVLTAPLSEGLKRGIQNLDQGANSEYNINMDFRGALIKEDVDIERAVTKVLNEKQSRLGRSRRIG